MKKQILFAIGLYFILFQNLFAQTRYLANVFTEAQITSTDYKYATVHKSKCWNNAPTTGSCFLRTNYTLPAFNPNLNDDSIKLAIRVFRNASDPITTPKPTILFVQGGGYNATGTGLNAWDGTDENSKICKYFARRGYVVVAVDYRKGWDMTNVNVNDCVTGQPLNPPPVASLCPNYTGNSCDAFTFMEATYRMVQDIRGAHRYIINNCSALQIDTNKIFYYGFSTGAIGVMHAAFGCETGELVDYYEFPNNTGRKLSDITSCGLLDDIGQNLTNGKKIRIAGVGTLAGAIKKVDYIDNSDNVKFLQMTHSTLDEAVMYCTGSLLNFYMMNDPYSSDHLVLKGSGVIYNNAINQNYSNLKVELRSLNRLSHAVDIDATTLIALRQCNSQYETIKCGGATALNCNVIHSVFVDTLLRPFVRKMYSYILNPNYINSNLHYYYPQPWKGIGNNACGPCAIQMQNSSSNCTENQRINTQTEAIMDKIISDEYYLFPNPSNDKITINYISNNYTKKSINIYNLEGKLIKTSQINEDYNYVVIDIHDLPNAKYIVTVISSNNTIEKTLEFIKQ